MRTRVALQLEILALRHQLYVLERSRPRRLRLTGSDRLLWVWLSRVWQGWRTAVVIVAPETVIAWHRRGGELLPSRSPANKEMLPEVVRSLRSSRGTVKGTAVLLALVLSLSGLSCAESQLTLAPESRLPRWFTIPSAVSRADVAVTMRLYVWPSTRSATLRLWDSNGHKLTQVSASQKGVEPYTFAPSRRDGVLPYPSYEILTANGITEVVEYRQFDGRFYITDDPEIKRKLGLVKPVS